MTQSIRCRAVMESIESRTLFAISFLPAVHSQVGALSVLAGGDFNGDQHADVVARGQNDTRLHFFAGIGDGRFTVTNAATPIDAGPSVVSLVAADFNRDGMLDLAAANSATAANAGSVAVLHGNGNGTFGQATHYAAGPSPSAIATADFSRDGRLDLAVANDGAWPATTPGGPPTYAAALLFANNSGGFGNLLKLGLGFPTTAVTTMPQNSFIAASDTGSQVAFAGPNLLVASPTPATFIAILPTSINALAYTFSVPGENRGLAAVDLNRDGRMDVAALQILGGNTGANTAVNVFTVSSRITPTSTLPPYVLKGPFATGLASGFGIAAAQLDNDRIGDVAVAGTRSLGATLPAFTGSVAALAGTGDGALGTAKTFDVGAVPRAISAAHLNRDGRFDLVTTSGAGLSALLNAPGPTPSQTPYLGDDSPQGGDMDGNRPRVDELLA